MAVTFVLMTYSQAHASIVWHNDFQQFNYSVNQNGGVLYEAPTSFNPAASHTGSITDSTGSYSAQLNCQHSSYPLAGILEMKAGAQGNGTMTSPENGLQVRAYAQMNLNNFNPASQGVDVSQWVFSNVTRNLSVSSAGNYQFSTNLSGDADFNTFWGNDFFKSSYSVEGQARINKYSIDSSGNIKALGDGDATVEFTLSDTNKTGSTAVSLESQTSEGDDIFYQVVLALTLKTSLQNFSMQYGLIDPTGNPNFKGPFFLGDESNPMQLDAALAPAVTATPLPGSLLLLLSGISGLSVFRRFFKKD